MMRITDDHERRIRDFREMERLIKEAAKTAPAWPDGMTADDLIDMEKRRRWLKDDDS